MRRLATVLSLASAAAALPLVGCTAADDDLYDGETVKSEDGKDDSSAVALFVDFEFDGEMVTDYAWNKQQAIEDQLLYTIGQLNGANSVGRLDRLTLSNIQSTTENGRTRITYSAKMPVAWGDKNHVPSTFTLKLPRDMAYAALGTFATTYGHACAEAGAHDVDSGSMWYYFRPSRSGCHLTDADVLTTEATVSPSPINTTGKFPEYDKVWEDGVLQVVAVFGKYEDGATTSSDAGISAFNSFVSSIKGELPGATTIPASVPSSPGVATPDVEWNATLADGKQVRVVALLVDNVRNGGAAFDARYEALSTRADLIVYNGHAGLGSNVRAMAQKGSWTAGQYVIVFQNGCDTFAYIDDALNRAHAAVNADDPIGTRYIDTVVNGMPAYFANMAGSTMALFRALKNPADPKTYEQIFRAVSSSQVVLVTGEQDNTFTPGGGGTPTTWAGLTGDGTVTKGQEQRWETPVVAAGTYAFEMTGTKDADLYVRIGSAPDTTHYDCRPYKTGSNETCEVTLASPSTIHVMVRGYATSSTFELAGHAVE
ncbi:MAG: PPC domain-containing protein [Kofleriaceae bacterium]|nr:PPC domain-containing protein [Kofleriaceae bacterium]